MESNNKELLLLRRRLDILIKSVNSKSAHNKAVVETYRHVLSMIEQRIEILNFENEVLNTAKNQ